MRVVFTATPGRVFGPEMNFTGGEMESDLLVADFNHDGYPDLLAVNGGFFLGGSSYSLPGNGATVLLNLGVQTPPGTIPSSITLVPSAATIAAGSPVTFTATISAVNPGEPAPTGTIRFADQSGIETWVAAIPVGSSSSSATFTTSSLACARTP